MPTSKPNTLDDIEKVDPSVGAAKSDVQAMNAQVAEPTEEKKNDQWGSMPKGLKPPPPEAFKEPDANSLLDAFGF